MSPSTIKAYNSSLTLFHHFVKSLNGSFSSFPANPGHIALFITHLHKRGLAPSTISSKLSAVSFMHKLYNKIDPVQNFLVSKLLRGLRKIRPVNDTRLPMSPRMLLEVMGNMQNFGFSVFEQLIFRSMITLAFAAFLRPGEFTASPNNLQLADVTIYKSYIIIVFKKYKHSTGSPATLCIRANGTPYCPWVALVQYLQFRGNDAGPLFCNVDSRPVSYNCFAHWFEIVSVWLGAHGSLSPHSLRIGAATHAAASGMSDILIKQMGRWSSDAYKNYVRIPALCV